jgi:hypothetical protein
VSPRINKVSAWAVRFYRSRMSNILLVLASASCMDLYGSVAYSYLFNSQIPRYFLCWQLPAMCFDQVGDVIDRTELQDCLLVAVSDVVKGRTPPLLSHFRIRQSDGTLICNNKAGIYV